MLRVLAAVLSGLAIWAAFPGLGWWFLAPVGLGLLAAAAHGLGFWRGAGIGLIAGVASFLPLLSWAGVYVGNLPWIALATMEALYVAVGVGLYAWASRGKPGPRPVSFALLWTAAEIARSMTPFGGFPWVRIAFSQNESPLLGWVAVVGSVGLGFLVALLGALLARAATAAWRRQTVPAVLAVAVAGALAVVPLLIPRPTDGETISVVGIQGNVPRPGLDFNAERRQVLDNHATLTQEVAAEIAAGERDPVDLVLWPENSSDIDPIRNADAAAVVEGAVASIGVPIVVGAVLREPEPDTSNASLVYAPGEGEIARYVKRHPVPFAEWIPYRDFFALFSPYAEQAGNFVAGDNSGAVTVPLETGRDVVLGIGICFEVVYDELLQETIDSGADLLFIPTNNATFGYTDEAGQQTAASQVRAVEFGRTVVQVSTTGVSTIITPDGESLQPTDLFTRAVVQAEVPLRTELTVAARLGSIPAIAVGAGAGVVLLAALVGRVRGRDRAAGSVVGPALDAHGPGEGEKADE